MDVGWLAEVAHDAGEHEGVGAADFHMPVSLPFSATTRLSFRNLKNKEYARLWAEPCLMFRAVNDTNTLDVEAGRPEWGIDVISARDVQSRVGCTTT